MRSSFYCLLFGIFLLFVCSSSSRNPGVDYDFNRKYSVAELRADFNFLRKLLEQRHPRPYEYTRKDEFRPFLDSMYGALNKEMSEREFQFFLLPVIGKVHCSHTKLLPSQYLLDHMATYFSAPPFKLYFTADNAWLLENYSAEPSLLPGAEILSVNGVPIDQVRRNFLSRVTSEGLNSTFIYNRMNAGIWPNTGEFGLFPGLSDYPGIDSYALVFRNPGTDMEKKIKLPAIAYDDYPPFAASKHKKAYSLYTLDSQRTAVLTISSFLRSDEDHAFVHFIDSSFAVLAAGGFDDLVIDLRGNIGGIPDGSVRLLTYIMPEKFVYYAHGAGFDEYKAPIALAKNRFTGKVFFLIDGACRSTTGHFLAMAKYYRIGPIIGEEACASFSCNNNGTPHTLPNTHLIFECPESFYSVAVSGLQRGRGIMPDHTVTPSVADLIAGKDTVLQFALQLASRQTAP